MRACARVLGRYFNWTSRRFGVSTCPLWRARRNALQSAWRRASGVLANVRREAKTERVHFFLVSTWFALLCGNASMADCFLYFREIALFLIRRYLHLSRLGGTQFQNYPWLRLPRRTAEMYCEICWKQVSYCTRYFICSPNYARGEVFFHCV